MGVQGLGVEVYEEVIVMEAYVARIKSSRMLEWIALYYSTGLDLRFGYE
jgi:hypothetical protein